MLIILNVAHACWCQFGTIEFMPTLAHSFLCQLWHIFDEIVMVALSCLCQLKGELIKSTVQVSSPV